MMAYTQQQREPTCKELFSKKITTIQQLQNAYQDSAFFAIGTEHVAVTSQNEPVLHRVSLAYLPPLSQQSSSTLTTCQPCLQDFYEKNHIQALALNINMNRHGNGDPACVWGGTAVPARPPHRFGLEQQVDLDGLEAAIIAFIKHYSDQVNLVLIGFDMVVAWSYMSKFFPRATRFFSAWLDLRDLAKGTEPPVGYTQSLSSLLDSFRYHWIDIRLCMGNPHGSVAHNAGDDAVAICALANGLLILKTFEKPAARQRRGRVAGTSTRKKGSQAPDTQDPFTATTSAQGPLPSTVNSGMELPGHFSDPSHQSAGVMSTEMAHPTFSSQDPNEPIYDSDTWMDTADQ